MARVLGRKKNINIFDLNNFSKNFRILGNFILTKISNFINNQSLTDVHTIFIKVPFSLALSKE